MKYLKKDNNGYVAVKNCAYKITEQSCTTYSPGNNYSTKIVRKSGPCIEKYSKDAETIKTEITALKYFQETLPIRDGKNVFMIPNIPRIYSHGKNKILMEYVRGKPLVEYDNQKVTKHRDGTKTFTSMPRKWWRSLLLQLILTIDQFERQKILHNDFWDANILITPTKKKLFGCNFVITVLDFQYTNQYTPDSPLKSKMVNSKLKSDMAEKKRIGWSSKFHKGGDLNQILGLISDYKYIPEDLRHNLKKIVVKREGADFPYAISRANPKTTGEILLKNFDKLIPIK